MALMPVPEALANVLSGVMPLGPEQTGLRFALGRTLAHALAASLTHPPFDGSAMDGYAVRAADTNAASATTPVKLQVIGEAAAGWPFGATVGKGQAVRIFTGAPIPDGADAIVIQEDVVVADGAITITSAVAKSEHVRPRGQDFHDGDAILPRGRLLNARDLMLAAAAGHGMLAVTKRPVVAILATGDELVEPSDRPAAGEIISSNSYGIAALVEYAGGTAKLLGIANDDETDLATKIRDASDADILVTTGGASVGDHDLVRPALEASGATLHFYKIAMRPGKPMFFGTRPSHNGRQRIIGLPGNPVSAMIGARVFLVPLIAALLGRAVDDVHIHAELTEPLSANGPRDHYMRAMLDGSTVPARVTPLPNQDSGLVSVLASANALIIVPANTPVQRAGSRVRVMPLDF